MASTISTIMYNGQFWIALIEKYNDDGSLLVGKYTFGSEPTTQEILDFYLNKYELMRFHECATTHRKKKNYSPGEINRNTPKSFQAFQEEQKKYLQEHKKAIRAGIKKEELQKYLQKCKKRKEKRRGH